MSNFTNASSLAGRCSSAAPSMAYSGRRAEASHPCIPVRWRSEARYDFNSISIQYNIYSVTAIENTVITVIENTMVFIHFNGLI